MLEEEASPEMQKKAQEAQLLAKDLVIFACRPGYL